MEGGLKKTRRRGEGRRGEEQTCLRVSPLRVSVSVVEEASRLCPLQ
jgi:hypothetical protein